ncbi:MAG: signal peptidase I [Planctomycetaceae bacterium]|nr:signal peptidase I [Planctomycetaceae bacterium]
MAAIGAILGLLIPLAFVVIIIASLWKVFEKAGQPGWAAIVPFYNLYILTCEIAKKEILWFILMFIPLVNIVASVLVSIEVAKKFGKSELYGVGLAFLGFIFYPMLAFSDAKYQGGGSTTRSGGKRGYDDDESDADRKNW